MAVPIVSKIVPTIAGRIPPSLTPLYGKVVRNSHYIAGNPLINIKITTANIGMTVNNVVMVRKLNPSFCFVNREAEEPGFLNNFLTRSINSINPLRKYPFSSLMLFEYSRRGCNIYPKRNYK